MEKKQKQLNLQEEEKILARNIVNYSCKLKKGQSVIIEADLAAKSLVIEIMRQARKIGAMPFVFIKDECIEHEKMMGMTEEESKAYAKRIESFFKYADAGIRIKAPANIFEMSDVPLKKLNYFKKNYFEDIYRKYIIESKPWVLLNYPTPALAQNSNMSSEEYAKFYFNVCNLNYEKMHKAMEPLKKLMEKTDKVRIVSPGTDLTFSIKNMKAVICSAECNIPDGECYTAPVKNSVNGTITYNIPSTQDGVYVSSVCLNFKDGKIIKETAVRGQKKLTEVLNTDEGARFVGEFSFGVNPYVTFPINDILFDEKMCGSIHFTPGASYKDAYNGNTSSVHWDMVLCQLKEYGGGEIYFDDELIRKDGLFVIDSLKALNPENLI